MQELRVGTGVAVKRMRTGYEAQAGAEVKGIKSILAVTAPKYSFVTEEC